jgi:serine/threonine protein kinase
MEYLQGENLESIITSKEQGLGLLEASECIKVARSILAALKVLHSNGMVHRDIKPANMMRCHQHAADPKLTSRQKKASSHRDPYV